MIKHITYKDEKYPIRLSYSAIKGYEVETGKPFETFGSVITDLEIVLWYALVAGHKAEKKLLTIKREDVEDILDESLPEIQSIMMSFSSVPFGKEDIDLPKKK